MYCWNAIFPGVTHLSTPSVPDVPCRCLKWGFVTAGVPENVTPAVGAFGKVIDNEAVSGIIHFQVCRAGVINSQKAEDVRAERIC